MTKFAVTIAGVSIDPHVLASAASLESKVFKETNEQIMAIIIPARIRTERRMFDLFAAELMLMSVSIGVVL